MNTMRKLSGGSIRALRGLVVLGALGAFALPAAAHAEAGSGSAGEQRSTAGEVGHAVGSTMRDIGEGARDVGKAVGHGVVSAGKAVGHIARDAGVKIGHAARDGARGLAQGIKGEDE